jgi:beta-galactosidase/beta-glucuronidase
MMQLLDGPWELARDPGNAGRAERWFERCQAEARTAPVPGIIQQVFPDYHGVAWYWHTFRLVGDRRWGMGDGDKEIPSPIPHPPSPTYTLHFGAVDYLADVWLNGVHVGGHDGGETPFALDVTEALNLDGENLLAVRVLNPSDQPIDGIRLQETPHRNKFVKDYQPWGARTTPEGSSCP